MTTMTPKKILPVLAVLTLLIIPLYLLFFTFPAVDTPPSAQRLESVSPPNEATTVCVATEIRATFSDAADNYSIEAAFSIVPSLNGTIYWTGNTMTFVPSTNLEYDTTYTVTTTEGSWRFKTAKEGFPVTIVDDLGSTSTITDQPERIISLAPSNTEILFALGLDEKIVGVTEYCNYPPETEFKEKVGSYSTPHIEKIVNLNPDLVFAAYGNPGGAIDALKRFNVTVIGLNPRNLEEILCDLRLVGELTGTSANASVIVTDMTHRIAATDARMSTLKAEEKPTVLHIIWHDPIWVAGKGTFEDELISRCGGVNIAPVEGYKTLSLEKLIELNPDVIITPSGTGMGCTQTNFTYEYIIDEPRLRAINAVSTQRVYIINADIVCRAGPRIIEALEEMATMLHPELY